MKIEKFGQSSVTLHLSKHEVLFLQASVREALQETFNWAEQKSFFQSRIGWPDEAAEKIVDELTELYDALNKHDHQGATRGIE